MRRYGCVYLPLRRSGRAAFTFYRIVEVICWEDLGTEALRLIRVRDFPVTVAIDTDGSDLYEEGPAGWRVMHDVDADDIIAGK